MRFSHLLPLVLLAMSCHAPEAPTARPTPLTATAPVVGTYDDAPWSAHSAKAHHTADSLTLTLQGTDGQQLHVVVLQYRGAGHYPFANDADGQGIAYARLMPTTYSIGGACHLSQVDTSAKHLSATLQAQFVETTPQGPVEHRFELTASRIPLQMQ